MESLSAKTPELSIHYAASQWYAAYTSANHEKQVGRQLNERQIENFVPLYESARRWKDREVTVQLPLFPSYVFVRIALRDRLRVLQVPGVARLVEFNGIPAPLPDEEIAALHAGLENGIRVEPHPFLAIGRNVRIKGGPLAGMVGILRRRKGKSRVIISIDLLRLSVAVEMDDAAIVPDLERKSS